MLAERVYIELCSDQSGQEAEDKTYMIRLEASGAVAAEIKKCLEGKSMSEAGRGDELTTGIIERANNSKPK